MKNIFVILGILLILILASVGNACAIDTSNQTLQVRVNGAYGTTISAENNEDIDIKLSFDVDNITGTDCASNIYARARIYVWDNVNDEWDLDKTTSSQTFTLEEDTFEATWYNEFTIDGDEDRYRIEGYVTDDNNRIVDTNAYINVENNSCAGIDLITHDFTINEGNTRTQTFQIQNNTNKDFVINKADLLFSTSMFSDAEVSYDTLVRDGDTENIRLALTAEYFNTDKTAVGTFIVEGTLNGTFCSSYDIGRKNFEATINDTGTSGSGSTTSGTSSDCDELEIKTKNYTMNENSSVKEIFYIENNSTKRFELTDVKVIDSGIETNAFYFEKYAFPGTIADIVVQSSAGNITNNKVYENNISVSGKFSDGKTCEFDDIASKNFAITVENTGGISFATCDGFSINANDTTITNYGTVDFSITNNTNKIAIIYVEGSVSATPSEIVMPANSSIARTLTINSLNTSGNITFRPQVDGCTLASKTINITNNATGDLAQVSITTRIRTDANNSILVIEFYNPTNKTFVGVLSANIPGETIHDQTIAIPSGQSFTEIPLKNQTSNRGKVTFTANGNTIEQNFDESNANFTGYFLLGGNIATLGLILLIIIIIIVIVVAVTKRERIREAWEIYRFR
ncbi:MAG: hypothetical protein WC915_03170 [archaeon]